MQIDSVNSFMGLTNFACRRAEIFEFLKDLGDFNENQLWGIHRLIWSKLSEYHFDLAALEFSKPEYDSDNFWHMTRNEFRAAYKNIRDTIPLELGLYSLLEERKDEGLQHISAEDLITTQRTLLRLARFASNQGFQLEKKWKREPLIRSSPKALPEADKLVFNLMTIYCDVALADVLISDQTPSLDSRCVWSFMRLILHDDDYKEITGSTYGLRDRAKKMKHLERDFSKK